MSLPSTIHQRSIAQNYLLIGNAQIPDRKSFHFDKQIPLKQKQKKTSTIFSPKSGKTFIHEEDDDDDDDNSIQEDGDWVIPIANIEFLHKIKHGGDVHRARYMPQNPSIIATKSSENYVKLVKVEVDGSSALICHLQGHEVGGWSLSWNTVDAGKLASGADDFTVCYWDLTKDSVLQANAETAKVSKRIANRRYAYHQGVVEDIDWRKDR